MNSEFFSLPETLNVIFQKDNLEAIRCDIDTLQKAIAESHLPHEDIIYRHQETEMSVGVAYLLAELDQIAATLTLERTKYYLKRLIKALEKVKTGKINDINLNRWKEYDDIFTDSLWLLDRRDTSGAHNAGYWGNFVPQIPNQLLRRYTKQGDWVLDTFLGSGTTLIESKRLGRNGIGIELQPEIAALAARNSAMESNPFDVRTEVVTANAIDVDYGRILAQCGISAVQFILMHPPYWDIIKFSNDRNDLSNVSTLHDFLTQMGRVAANVYRVLEKKRFCALVIGDKYAGGEWIPLAFYTMQEFLKIGYTLKSTIIKNFDETKGKLNQQELWRYRALVGGFYIFKHEYIFLFQK
ncbi:MAG: site-specific DNA-methyltransferase [Prevotellaceae bacterium]|jgi:16S rRNA G966 N2-methylase RsmD|nr:site-specific DNA-methyltransferase [Prevotellaceae bacterium]